MKTRKGRMRLWGVVGVCVVVLVASLLWLFIPQEADMDENQAIRQNEQWAAQVTEVFQDVPDFAGYERRTYGNLPCESGSFGQPTDLTVADVTYHFSRSDAENLQLRQGLRDKLPKFFSRNGFAVIRDDEFGDGTEFSLVGQRDSDEFQVALQAKGLVSLTISSPCATPSADKPTDIPPAGGASAD